MRYRMGPRQREFLRQLLDHKKWHENCGWIWGTNSRTIEILESLVTRGLVHREMHERKLAKPITIYTPSELALKGEWN